MNTGIHHRGKRCEHWHLLGRKVWEHWHSPRRKDWHSPQRKAWEQRLGKTEEKIIPMVVPDQDRSKKVRTKVCPWIQQLGSHQ